jgi:hypothetical protein
VRPRRDHRYLPPVDHKISREDFLAQAKATGLTLLEEPTFLPYQYFLVFARRE